MSAESDVRTGFGVDVHAFGGPGPVVLAGVAIPHPRGLVGHSDADAAAHAATDALLGAAGLGDIGQHFPDTDERWAGADSLALLADVRDRVTGEGWTVGNVDVTIVCESPRIGPHRDQMRGRLAGALDVDPGRVNVKATTTEGLGFTGRGEGVTALAVATLVRDGLEREGR